MTDEKRIEKLGAEIERLESELEKAAGREHDLSDTRRAMLYLLEDINENASFMERAKKEWEATFDSISDLLFIHDSGMRIIRCNMAYKEASGLGFHEIIGRPYYEVFPKMDGPFDLCREAAANCSEEAAEHEVDIPLLGKVYKIRFYTIKGDGVLSIHVMEDITFEKVAEEALKESEDKYHHLFDNLKDAAFLADIDTGRIVETNRTGEIMLGRSRSEIIGMHQSELHPAEKADMYKKMFVEHALKGHESNEGELVRKDGATVPVMIRGDRIRIKGRDFLLGIFRDITEQKKNEEKIAQEAEINRNLLMIANATAHTTDIDRLMEQVAGCLQKIMRSDISLSYVWDNSRKVFMPSRAAGLAHAQVPFFRVERLGLDTSFVARALNAGKTVIEDCRDGHSCLIKEKAAATGVPVAVAGVKDKAKENAPLYWLDSIGRAVVFPLLGRQGCLGLLVCVYAGGRELPEFGRRDHEVWDGISFQVSTALDEARLYKESIDRTMDLSRKIETIQTMHEIDTAILSAFQSDEILETAARMVAKAVLCDRATIALVDRRKGGFTYAAGFGTASIKKQDFTNFNDTSATEVVRTGMPQYVPNIKESGEVLPLERSFSDEGFASHIRVPLTVRGEVTGVLTAGSKRTAAFSSEDLSIMEKLAAQIGIALENARLLKDVEELFIGTVKTLSEAIDAKSPWTRGHSERVTAIALSIARELGFVEQEMKDLELAGLLHDIGKLGTYESILDKPGRLTAEELDIMKQHPAKGAEILAPIKQLGHIVPAIKHHHEYYDGTGYPAGIKGEEIPLMARILTVADTVDAMGADRPYRKGKPMSDIVAELKRCSGTQFDPEIVEAFFKTTEAAFSG